MRIKDAVACCLRLFFWAICTPGLIGCDSAASRSLILVAPDGIGIDRTAQTLTNLSGSRIVPKLLKGTYGPTCKLHQGELWDLTLNDPTDRTVEFELNDTFANCSLLLTTISVQVNAGGIQDYALAKPILLGNSYAAEPTAVYFPNSLSPAFFANAKFSGLDTSLYNSNFSINLVYSDNALGCSVTAPAAIYAKLSVFVVGTSASPPTYTLDFGALRLDVDANLVVQDSSSGDAVLRLSLSQPQPGEQWRLFDESSKCCRSYSFPTIDTIYRNITPIAVGNITAVTDVSIPWTRFDLVGKRLPRTRTLIVKHTSGSGVVSYELFQVLFLGPLP